MSHVLHALIGPSPTVAEFASRWNQARFVRLSQEFALVPMTPHLFDDIEDLVRVNKPSHFPDFERLSAGLESVIREVSWVGPLAYFETDYFGGSGTQKAIAWHKGRIISGPLASETTWDGNKFVTMPFNERAINRVLTILGIWTNGKSDQFDMLGLGKFRETESVAERYGQKQP